MDVMNVEQAKIAEAAGAVAVMALERTPADIRRDGGVARMSDPALILEIKNAVTIPVMAKCRIGHLAEAQILEACEVDYIDESEVLTMADDVHHLDKTQYSVPFVCGCRNLGEAFMLGKCHLRKTFTWTYRNASIRFELIRNRYNTTRRQFILYILWKTDQTS